MTTTTEHPTYDRHPATPPQPANRVTPLAPKTPWYRRLWVLIAGAALLVLLSFAGGFAVGSASSLLNAVTGVPSGTQGGPGSFEGGPRGMPGDGQPPQGGPGQGGPMQQDDQQSGTDGSTNS